MLEKNYIDKHIQVTYGEQMCAQSSPPNFHEECRKKFLTFFHSSPLINLQYSRAGMRGKKSVLFKMTAALAAEAEGG